MAEITLAANAGFCFGVRRAVNTAKKLAREAPDRHIYTLGKLIHNAHVIHELEALGIHSINETELDRVIEKAGENAPVSVIVRAHGAMSETMAKLKSAAASNPFFAFYDCTCPNVSKIHDIAENQTDENSIFVIIGAPEHPEVRSIVSFAHGKVYVFESSSALECFISAHGSEVFSQNRLILTAQTTQNLYEWENCQKILQKVCTNPIIFDTICDVTEMRQTEVKRLAAENEAVIIIGDKDSSNSNKLYQVSRSVNPNSFFVQDTSQLDRMVLSPFTKIAITAGASTPDGIIQEVFTTMSENFEQMLNESFKTILTGDTVTGVVLGVSPSEVTVDLGCKVTGIIPYNEITDTPGVDLSTMFKPGDEVEAIVLRISDMDGMATLSKKKIDSKKNFNALVEAKDTGITLEGRVVDVVKGGIIVSSNLVRIFIPASQTGVPKDGDLKSLLGTNVKFKVIEVEPARRRIVGSIRNAAYEERQAKLDEFWANVEVGKSYVGKVVSLASYGAFVLLDGIAKGLVHNEELSWRRIKSPAEVVNVGDDITVTVKSLNDEKKRISLAYKNPDEDPWKLIGEKYNVGDVIDVKITAVIDDLGAFAEVVPGQDGLIHISQIARERVEKASDKLKTGDVVTAKITAIDSENKKISLSIRALLEDENKADEENADETAE